MKRTSRERELAGERRAGAFARGKARRAQRQFARKNWRILTFGLVLWSSPAALAYFFIADEFLRGLAMGAVVAAAVAYMIFFVVQVTGTASIMMGDEAERFTVDELRPLRRQGWRVVNRMGLKKPDIDHVLVGPGGAFALESKWSSEPWQLDPPSDRVVSAVRQVSESARLLGLWSGFRKAGVTQVHPVVVLWGGGIAATSPDDAVRDVDGTTVIAGPHAARWRATLPQRELTADEVDRAWSAMSTHLVTRDPVDEARHPVPTALTTMMWRAWSFVVGAAASLLAASQLIGRVPAQAWIPTGVAMGLAGWWLRRWATLRLAAFGWMTGVLCVGIFLAGLYVVLTIR